jgi:hypothetical protein
MVANVHAGALPRRTVWVGRIVTWLPALFLLLDGAAKLFKPAPVVEGTLKLGYSESIIIPLGIILIVCTVLYLIPRTAVLGAVLLTGYLGGAVATHVSRLGDGWFGVVFAVTFGVLLWLGLYLRDARIRELLPLRN